MKKRIDKEKIISEVLPSLRGIELAVFDSIDSTNDYAKGIAKSDREKSPLAVAAYEQTRGRGTRERSFISRGGAGVYMSILFYPEERITPADITVYAAVAASRAIEKVSMLKCGIKWVNDVYVGGRKLAGILTEGNMCDGALQYAVVGIGINTNAEVFPEEICDIATSVKIETQRSVINEALIAEIINSFFSTLNTLGSRKVMDEYRARSVLIGKRVRVSSSKGEFEGRVAEICDTGAILIEKNDKITVLLESGDVSLKITEESD